MGEVVTRKYICDWCGAVHEAQDAPGVNPDQAEKPWDWGSVVRDTGDLKQPAPGTRCSSWPLEVVRGKFQPQNNALPEVISEVVCGTCIDVIVQNVEDAKRQCKARNK